MGPGIDCCLYCTTGGKGSLRKVCRTPFSSKLLWLQNRKKYARCIAPGKVQLFSISVCDYAGHQSAAADDSIPHDKLLKALQFYCKEKWISLYVSRWLKASVVQEDGSYVQPQSGTPQGGVISPLLANLYLHSLSRIAG